MSKMRLDFSQLEIPKTEIYDYMGYRGVEPDSDIRELTERLIHEASEYVIPCFDYHILDGCVDREIVKLESLSSEVEFHTGKYLQPVTSAKNCSVCCHCRKGYDTWIKEINKRDDIL